MDGSRDGEVALPGLGTAGGFTGKRKDRETFYSFTSFTTPTEVFRYDFDKRGSELLFKPKVKFNPDDYTTEQVFYKSRDGTRIPMFISYKKGMKRDGQNPTYLFGYGGFDISETPTFSPENLVWMEMGGIFVLPNLRGGSVLDRQSLHVHAETCHRRQKQWRVARWRVHHPASRSLRRGFARGWSDGHAAL